MGISLAEFSNTHKFFTFNLSPDLSFANHQIPKDDNLRLSLKFKNALPEAYNVILYGKFDSEIQITKDYVVINDFKYDPIISLNSFSSINTHLDKCARTRSIRLPMLLLVKVLVVLILLIAFLNILMKTLPLLLTHIRATSQENIGSQYTELQNCTKYSIH